MNGQNNFPSLVMKVKIRAGWSRRRRCLHGIAFLAMALIPAYTQIQLFTHLYRHHIITINHSNFFNDNGFLWIFPNSPGWKPPAVPFQKQFSLILTSSTKTRITSNPFFFYTKCSYLIPEAHKSRNIVYDEKRNRKPNEKERNC